MLREGAAAGSGTFPGIFFRGLNPEKAVGVDWGNTVHGFFGQDGRPRPVGRFLFWRGNHAPAITT